MAIKKCWAVFHNDPSTVQTSSMGYSIVEKNKGIQHLYTAEETALDVANEIAAKHPGTQVVVLEAKIIVESKIPDTIAKTWKENGELLPLERVVKEKKVKVRFDPLDDIARQLYDDQAPRPPELRPRRVAQVQVDRNDFRFAEVQPQGAVAGGPIPDPNPPRERGF